jgi:adenylate cyclase
MANTSTERPSQQRTFAFVDLAGFTALTEVHGDEEAVQQIDRFVDLTRASLGSGDQLVKCMGDAVMLCFDAPDAALACVVRLLNGCQHLESFPMPRAGLHHGPAIERNDDWFGATVNLAARVASQAHGGQTLGTTPIARAARSQAIPVTELGCFTLRNVAQRVELYELGLVAPIEATSLDPVCRMQVRHSNAAGHLRHDARAWWFCSLVCARAFAEDPDLYTNAR